MAQRGENKKKLFRPSLTRGAGMVYLPACLNERNKRTKKNRTTEEALWRGSGGAGWLLLLVVVWLGNA